MRSLAGFFIVALAALSLAPRANALPDLVSSDTPPGWSFPALPRSSGDATAGSVVLQAPALPGESANTWFNGSMHNIGNATASNAFTGLYLDGVLRTLQGPFSVPASAYGRYVNIQSSVVIKGGRHTLLSSADVFGGVTESNESNNDWARQYIWSPLPLTAGSPVTRTYDPVSYAGTAGPWPNAEGFSGVVDSGHWWYAFACMPEQTGTDYDMIVNGVAPSNNPQAGFAGPLGWQWAGDHIEVGIINRNIAPSGTYYAGVINSFGTDNKVVQFEAAPNVTFFTPGVYGPYTMNAGDLVDVHELYAFTGATLQIEIRPLSGDANFGAYLVSPTANGLASIADPATGVLADSHFAGESEILSVNLSSGSYYGLVIFKPHSADRTKSVTYEIIVSSYPNLAANYTPPGWSGPIVVENNDTGSEPFTLPPTLNGNQYTTSFVGADFNYGPAATTSTFYDEILVDDERYWTFVRDSSLPVYPGTYAYDQSPTGGFASLVTGGRHHLRHDVDATNTIDELPPYENDNTFTDWFVWTPLELAPQVPYSRRFPPTRTPQGWGPWESCEGYRFTATTGYFWSAVGMIPTSMSSDYDVRLHTASTGSKDGFGPWLAWSDDPFSGNPDFCVVNYNMTSTGTHDLSVINWNGSHESYYIQRADAGYFGQPPPGISYYGPMNLPDRACLNIHEFYLTAGTPRFFSVVNLDGGADLELYLFGGTSDVYYTKRTSLAFANNAGPGESEQFGPVTVPQDGFYAVVVAKSKATDVYRSANYQIAISDQGLVDVPPAGTALPMQFALSTAGPNPATDGTSFELAVPQGQGTATVSVYDLAGRRVRTLVQGEVSPGRHRIAWDGRDAFGKRSAPGLYLAKLDAPHVKVTRKITLLQ